MTLQNFVDRSLPAISAEWLNQVDVMKESAVNVKDPRYGAVGDGVTDDTAAIQAAINYISPTTYNPTTGGGEVLFPPGKYRITSGLVVGWGTRLVGTGSGGFPYNGTNSKHSIIVADFGVNVNQWIIDSATYNKPAGTRVAYNAFVGADLDGSFSAVHQVGIEGLHITCADQTVNIIYGGVRLVGCPDAKINDVTVLGCGIALQLNCCFTAEVTHWHSETHYYGAVLFESNNACRVDGYFNKIINPSSLAVPGGVVLSFLPDAANMVGVLEVDGSHASSAKGVIVAAPAGSSSQVADLSIVAEYWPDTVFLFNSYSTVFRKLYTESTLVNFVVAGAYCSATIEALSVFAANAKVFDIGFDGRIDARIQGIFIAAATFNAVSDNAGAENGANVKMRGLSAYGQAQLGRVSWEQEAKPIAYISFDGSDLSIKNAYNAVAVSRVAGEPVGDYWVDFRRPSNHMSAHGEPVALVHLSGFGFACTPMGGGDGVQNTRIRVRCLTDTGAVFNPNRVMVTIFG